VREQKNQPAPFRDRGKSGCFSMYIESVKVELINFCLHPEKKNIINRLDYRMLRSLPNATIDKIL
jgi:hypothetical protein